MADRIVTTGPQEERCLNLLTERLNLQRVADGLPEVTNDQVFAQQMNRVLQNIVQSEIPREANRVAEAFKLADAPTRTQVKTLLSVS